MPKCMPKLNALAIVLSALFILTACKTTGMSSILGGGETATLPTFQVGDQFEYINDRKEKVIRTVTAVQGETVAWDTETSYHYVGYRNFILPRIQWEGVHSRGRAISGLPADLLWPLVPGTEKTFTVEFERYDKVKKQSRQYEQKWTCKVYKPREVKVPAGTFDANKITCKEKSKKGRAMRTRQWFYAPSIGNFVKRVKRYKDGATLNMDLVAVNKVPRVPLPEQK